MALVCPAKLIAPWRTEECRPRIARDLTCTAQSVITPASTGDNYHKTLEALKSRDRRPKRWLGQNYMVNGNINEEIVNAAEIKPGDVVLEIGPGTGALTDALLRAGASVVAVEKDPDMVSLVSQRFKDNPQVKVFHEDFLKWHDEAAARFVDDSPTGDEYRPISIYIRFYSELKYKFKVDRSNFFPQPPVDGAVVSFSLKDASQYPKVKSINSFFTMVNSAFNGKRKMLRTSLRHLYTSAEVEAALCSIGVTEKARPHQLTFDQFVSLHNALVGNA